MKLRSLPCSFFSSCSRKERVWRTVCLLFTTVLVLVLYLFWHPLRSSELTYPFVSFTLTRPYLRIISRMITTLGSEGFFLAVLSIVYWSINKGFAFWGIVVMSLSILITSEIPKDLTRLPRPSVRGVSAPTYTFPSGHTSGAVSVWGYAAIMIRKRWFWGLALLVMVLVGLSRISLGYHFPGDVIGGFISGVLFLVLSFGAVFEFTRATILRQAPVYLVLVLVVVLSFVFSFMPVRMAPGLLGYLAGAVTGYLLEQKHLRFSVHGSLSQHLLRAVLGLPPLAGVILGLGLVMPTSPSWITFIQYALATLWVTYLAPHVFCKLALVSQDAHTC